MLENKLITVKVLEEHIARSKGTIHKPNYDLDYDSPIGNAIYNLPELKDYLYSVHCEGIFADHMSNGKDYFAPLPWSAIVFQVTFDLKYYYPVCKSSRIRFKRWLKNLFGMKNDFGLANWEPEPFEFKVMFEQIDYDKSSIVDIDKVSDADLFAMYL